ncbi:reverse transcriptase [uncultured Bacteroides sp.]|uniref:reverse transcriptase n=1 Tax=uncultured Bacteroides sp. TaxID=162156 RepID=UPI002616B5B0|nr:reverse transcriptase [uncultured Bacteroides sp.]
MDKNDMDWRSMTQEEIDVMIAQRIDADRKRIEANGGKRPKRAGYILERMAEMDNLRAADKEAQDGKVRKNRFIRRHNLHPEADLRALQLMILTLDFPAPDYSVMSLRSDAGKVRDIVKQKYFPWRILHHAIMRVIGEDLYKSLIYDTSACIKGKGLHFGVRRMKRFLRRYSEYTWFVKTDFKKFYQSIPHELVLASLRKKFKDERFIRLIEVAVLSYDSGTEVIKILENEVERKKRSSHWSVYQPAHRQLCGQPDRPCNEGKVPREMPAQVL